MKKVLIGVICLLFLCTGCIQKELTPVENAALSAKQLKQVYVKLYRNYNRLESELQGKDLEKLKKSAPLLNKAKKYLIKYNELVIQWQKTGVTDFSVLMKNKETMQKTLYDASEIMLEFL